MPAPVPPPSVLTAPPFSASPEPLGVFLERGAFAPASIQRSYAWRAEQAEALYLELAKTFAAASRDRAGDGAAADDDTDAAAEDAAAEEAADESIDDDGVDAEEAAAYRAEMVVAPLTLSAPPPDAAAQTMFFLGAMILAPQPSGVALIYDGLQRTTALTILLAVLRDQLAKPNAAEAARLHRFIAAEDGAARLLLSRHDDVLATTVQSEGATLGRPNRSAASEGLVRRVLKTRSRLRHRLSDRVAWPPERLAAFAEFLLSNVWINVQSFRRGDDARRAFVWTNLYGLPLDGIDVLKGQIGALAGDGPLGEEAAAAFQRLRDADRDGFETALRATDLMMRRRPQGESWATDLGAALESALPPEHAAAWVQAVDWRITRWTEIKRIFKTGEARRWRRRENTPINRARTRIQRNIFRLSPFHWTEWRPLAIYWWEQYLEELHTARRAQYLRPSGLFDRLFMRLHRACMAVTLVGFDDADRSLIFSNAMAWSARGDANGRPRDPFLSGRPLDMRRKQGGETTTARQAKIARALRAHITDQPVWASLIRWIEARNWRDDLPALLGQASAEHILPRRPPHDAPQTLALGRDYDRYCYSIGNLALLPSAANDGFGNAPPEDKFGTYKAHAGLSAPEKYETLVGVGDSGAWGAAEIETRERRMIEEAWEALGFDLDELPPAEA